MSTFGFSSHDQVVNELVPDCSSNKILTASLRSEEEEMLSSDDEWDSEGVFIESFADAVAVVDEGPPVDHQLALVLVEAAATLVQK